MPLGIAGLQRTRNMPQEYSREGLRYLKRFRPKAYKLCVAQFAEAISAAYSTHVALPPLRDIPAFDDIPDAFADYDPDAIGPDGGWRRGSGLANFVFAAGLQNEVPSEHDKQYGTRSAEWRPFKPPVSTTIIDLARTVARQQSLSFREVILDRNLADEMRRARERKNLAVLIADPRTLTIPAYKERVALFDEDTWEGTAVLLAWNEQLGPWDDKKRKTVADCFPVRCTDKLPRFQAPITNASELERTLNITLASLRAAITEAESKKPTDDPPPTLAGPGEAE
jgi:FxsC-like protein